MRSRLLRYWWAAPILVLYVLVVSEMYIRVVQPTKIQPRYVIGAEYGVRMNKPSMTYYHTGKDYRVRFEINSKGIRADREIAYDKPASTYRIVAFGDSFGMGYEVELGDAWLSVLERELNQSGRCNVEVVNLSVSGHGTAEELVTYLHEGDKYHPDLVLVEWHQTDLDDNLRSRLFTLEDGALVQANETYLPPIENAALLESQVYRLIAENSMFYAWARQSLSTRVQRIMAATANKDLDQAHSAGADLSAREGLSIALLDRFATEARQRGAAFYVLDVPWREDRVTFTSSFPEVSSISSNVYSPIADFALRRGEILYWEDDFGHFTPLGNSIVGAGLAKRIAPLCGEAASRTLSHP